MTEEVKIHQQHGIKEPARFPKGKKAAREYRRQQQNGNLERAHRLGENLCALFLGMPVEGEYAAQQWVLLSYLVENELEQQVENPLLEQSAHSRFAEELEQQAPELARTVHDARAFTLYTLNETRRTPRSEGRDLRQAVRKAGAGGGHRAGRAPGGGIHLPHYGSGVGRGLSYRITAEKGTKPWNRICFTEGCVPAASPPGGSPYAHLLHLPGGRAAGHAGSGQ